MFGGKHGLAVAWIAVVILFLAVSATAQSILTQTSLGTGFIVSSDGYIITNKHVIKGATDITVKIGGKDYKAKVVDSLSDNDIALLKIDAHGLPTVMLGNSDNVQIGDTVYAIGCPAGVCGTITKGRIANLGVPSKTDEGTILHNLIMTDLTTTHGSSGGPLLNDRGEVIGITTAGVVIQRPTGYETTGFGLSIPINQAIPLLQEVPGFSTSQMGKATTVLPLDGIRGMVGPGTSLVKAEAQRSLSEFLPQEALGIKLKVSGPPLLRFSVPPLVLMRGLFSKNAYASARVDYGQTSRIVDVGIFQYSSAKKAYEGEVSNNIDDIILTMSSNVKILSADKVILKKTEIFQDIKLIIRVKVGLSGGMNANIAVQANAIFVLGNLLFAINIEDIDTQRINLPMNGCIASTGIGSTSWQENNGQISLIYVYRSCEDEIFDNPPTKDVYQSAINLDDFLHDFQRLIDTVLNTALAAMGSQ